MSCMCLNNDFVLTWGTKPVKPCQVKLKSLVIPYKKYVYVYLLIIENNWLTQNWSQWSYTWETRYTCLKVVATTFHQHSLTISVSLCLLGLAESLCNQHRQSVCSKNNNLGLKWPKMVKIGPKMRFLAGSATFTPETNTPETITPGDNNPARHSPRTTITPDDNYPRRQSPHDDKYPAYNSSNLFGFELGINISEEFFVEGGCNYKRVNGLNDGIWCSYQAETSWNDLEDDIPESTMNSR